MADPSVTITDLRIDDQSVSCTITYTGDPELVASSTVYVYDSTNEIQKFDELGRWTIAESHQHNIHYDLPGDLADGDYTVWIKGEVVRDDPNSGLSDYLAEGQEGLSFLVGRGRIYRSAEEAHQPDEANTVSIQRLRLEGTWLAFDMENKATHDVSVDHDVMVTANADNSTFHEAKGEEVVHAGATQSGHYLLPETIPDGSYSVWVNVRLEGAKGIDFAQLNFEAHDGALTVVP